MKRVLRATVITLFLLVALPTARNVAADGRLRLVSQTAWVTPGTDFELRLQPEDYEPGATMVVSLFPRISSRSAFGLSVEGTVRGRAIHSQTVDLTATPPDPAGVIIVRIPAADPAQVRLPAAGVYPVTVQLRDSDGEEADRFVTHLVNTGTPTGSPLQVAVALPIHSRPSIDASGEREVASQFRQATTGLLAALSQNASIPVGLLPTPETLEALAVASDDEAKVILDSLKAAATERELFSSTYVPVDQLEKSPFESELREQLNEGSRVTSTVLGTGVDPRTWIALDDIDGSALGRLGNRGFDRFVVGEQLLAPDDAARFTPTRPFEIASGDESSIQAVVADGALTEHFNAEDPVLGGHQLLADLAVIFFDSPSTTSPRGVAVVAPRNRVADAALMNTFLSGVQTSPICEGVRFAELFGGVPQETRGGRPLVRKLGAGEALTSPEVDEVRGLRSDVNSFQSLVANDNPVADGFNDRLMIAASTDLRSNERRSYLARIDEAIRDELDKVRMPPNHARRLTGREGRLPVTIQNETDYAINAVLHVESDKLEFAAGEERAIILDHLNNTHMIVVHARTSGVFPLRLRLTSPDGRLTLGATTVTVNASAASWVGVVLSIGAAAVLAWWWGRHTYTNRPGRHIRGRPASSDG